MDKEYAEQIKLQVKELNQLIFDAEDRGLDVTIIQYAKIANHELQVKITKTIEL
jgi:hypothetical protein